MNDVNQTLPVIKKDFKIIAIRPAVKCNRNFLKALVVGELYQLNHDFVIEKDHISYQPSYPEDLFEVNGISINISAVAGKNGSAKSSLFELLFAGLYNLALTEKVLDPTPKPDSKLTTVPDPPKDVHFELYYKIDEQICLMTFADQLISWQLFSNSFDEPNLYTPDDAATPAYRDLSFFYSIVINYSLYALNTHELGDWLTLLFHKNDSYQTPVVINPFRDEGNVNVNVENELVRSRLLFNLLKPIEDDAEKSLRNLSPGKTARDFTLMLDKNKFDDPPFFGNNLYESQEAEFRVREVLEVFLDRKVDPENNHLNRYAVKYILSKLQSITETYKTYSTFKTIYETPPELILPLIKEKLTAEHDSLFSKYIRVLVDDPSHITYKLWRAIHFLFYDFIPKNNDVYNVPVEDLSKAIYSYANDTIPIIQLLPPSFFTVDINFDKGTFDQLSSGEKQKIYSTYSIIYHLMNLDSVKHGLIRYEHVSCIFDEIELYYHPDLQRTYISDLLHTLSKTTLKDIHSINFTFITHSPFILSDIPRSNILYLKVDSDGNAHVEKVEQQSFGANIYDLLASSFYFEKGFMGALAADKIQQVIDNLQDIEPDAELKLEEWKIKQVIEIIGDPFLRDKLMEMYERKFKDQSLRLKKIKELEHRLKHLKDFK